jgi:predicted acetyltransferase
MKQHGYHVSMLFGIPNFYHRFGFATTLADYSIAVDASELVTCGSAKWRLREAKPGDIRAIQKIHEANDAYVACSLLRSAAHLTNKWERHKTFHVLTTEHGKVGAYFIASRVTDHLRVSEVGVSETGVCEEVLAACARLAAEESMGRVLFLVPPPHPFARYLLLHRSTHEMRVVRDSGGMLAFVNLAEALENLIPEWESLLSLSALREQRIEFTFLVDKIAYRVRANRGAIDVANASGKNKVSLTSSELMHLVTGYRYVEDILAARRRLITSEARALIEVLFPKRSAYVWEFDRF